MFQYNFNKSDQDPWLISAVVAANKLAARNFIFGIKLWNKKTIFFLPTWMMILFFCVLFLYQRFGALDTMSLLMENDGVFMFGINLQVSFTTLITKVNSIVLQFKPC